MKKKRGIIRNEIKEDCIRASAHFDPIICSGAGGQQYHHEQAGFAPIQHYHDWSGIRVSGYLYLI